MKNLPSSFKRYFWDVRFENLDLKRHRIYILKRLLEYGDEKAIDWMRSHFKESEIRGVLCKSRGFSQKTANFWSIVLDIPKKDILCLKRRSSKEAKINWAY
ncbi:MAG: hypothetical protein KKD11_08535 [Candidatus Omnitrophica bacterium]|nr:hypothetical protein [Candidatus Omnitrophota bacterium]